jgi:hypothetical protein
MKDLEKSRSNLNKKHKVNIYSHTNAEKRMDPKVVYLDWKNNSLDDEGFTPIVSRKEQKKVDLKKVV